MAPARYVGIALLSLVALYTVSLGLSFVLFPSDNQFDTQEAVTSLYGTEPKYLLFNLEKLSRPGPRLLVFGASAAVIGFRPKEIEPLLGVPVSNLALGSSTISEMGQVIDLAFRHIPPSAWHETTVVLGIFHGQFISDGKVWRDGMTDVDIEGTRYGLYSYRGLGRIEPRFKPRTMSMLAFLLRPELLFSGPYRAITNGYSDLESDTSLRLVGARPVFPDNVDLNTYVMTQADREAAIRIYNAETSFDDKIFPDLVTIAQKVSQKGGRLVIVDLPVPSWHRAGVPADAEYRRRLAAIMPQLTKLPNVSVVSRFDYFADADFVDGAHARPRNTPKWAKMLVEILRSPPRRAP